MTINDLYQKSLTGDKQAESELFRKLSEGFRVFLHQRIWNKDEIEDISQAALATVASEYKKVEITTSFSSWAYKVAEYRFLAYIQTRRRETGRYLELNETDGYDQNSESEASLKEPLLHCLRKVGSSKRQYARVLCLVYQGYNVKEICKRMQITINHSYVMLSRARSDLRKCLTKAGIRL